MGLKRVLRLPDGPDAKTVDVASSSCFRLDISDGPALSLSSLGLFQKDDLSPIITIFSYKSIQNISCKIKLNKYPISSVPKVSDHCESKRGTVLLNVILRSTISPTPTI